MKLKTTTNVNRHPKSTLNIEVAHVGVDEPDYISKLDIAFANSLEIENSLCLDKYRFRICRSILIDDKRSPDFDRPEWFRLVHKHLPERLEMIDFVTFESDLKNLLNTFYSRLRHEKQVNVKNEIERYLAKRKRTACSHDIAVWHALRLGALGGKGMPVYEIQSQNSGTSALSGSFVATNICSILPRTDRNHEEDAETNILRHLNPRYGDWKRVKRYYY